MQFGGGGVGTHADGDGDGGVSAEGGAVGGMVWTVRVGSAGEGESENVVPAVGDRPEEHLQRRGGGEEIVGNEGVELLARAGEGG